METHKFSDFANVEQLEGEKMGLKDVIDKTILVVAKKTIPDKFAEKPDATVTIIQFEIGGKKFVTFTRSGVLISQLNMMTDNHRLPFTAKIVKKKRYLTFE